MRCLLVTPVSPLAESSGAQQRSALLWRAMQRLAVTDVWVLAADPAHAAQQDMPDGTRLVVSALRAAALHEALQTHLPQPLADYDLVVFRYLSSMRAVRVPSGVPVVVDLDDLRYRFSAQVWSRPSVWLARLRKDVAAWLNRPRLARLQGAFHVSALDVGPQHSMLLPNLPLPAPAAHLRQSDTQTVLMVGSLWYGPNALGVDWFLRKVWPQLRAARPQLRLVLAGAAPAAQRARWAAVAGVSAPGFAADLAALYAQAALVVVPIQSGGGSNIKLLEALEYACPCVASAFSHRPLAQWLDAGAHLRVAHDAADFARHCIQLLDDGAAATRLGLAGQARLREQLSAARLVREASAFLQRCVPHD